MHPENKNLSAPLRPSLWPRCWPNLVTSFKNRSVGMPQMQGLNPVPWYLGCLIIKNPTAPFATQNLQNPSPDAPALNRTPRSSPELEALKLRNARSGRACHNFEITNADPLCQRNARYRVRFCKFKAPWFDLFPTGRQSADFETDKNSVGWI